MGIQGIQIYHDLDSTYNDLKAGRAHDFTVAEEYISGFFNHIYFATFTSCSSKHFLSQGLCFMDT